MTETEKEALNRTPDKVSKLEERVRKVEDLVRHPGRKLVAGTNIEIVGDMISSTAREGSGRGATGNLTYNVFKQGTLHVYQVVGQDLGAAGPFS